LLSKLIAWGNSREETIARLRRSLEEYTVSGIKTNAALFRRILADPEFVRGEIYTTWLDELLKRNPISNAPENGSEDAAAIGAAVWQAMQSTSAATPAAPDEAPSRWKRDGRDRQLDRIP
jgi:acetyl/propionyl-CoA carboxylase alpha subunit